MKELNCQIENCNGKLLAKGWCNKHYKRNHIYGNPLFTKINRGTGDTKEERFWSKVDKTSNPNGCWEWLGTLTSRGYGSFIYNYKYWQTHRFAWYLTYGKISDNFLLHSCDNPKCCNPKHLREGTQKDNGKDRTERNISAKGENHFKSKLKNEQVLEIFNSQEYYKILCEKYNIHSSTFFAIKSSLSWGHLTGKTYKKYER